MSLTRQPATQDQHLVLYLLGLLPDEEAQRFDEASIVDDVFSARLRAAEDDLVDAYVKRTMADDTRVRFESAYLASPLRRERVAFAVRFLATIEGAAARPDGAGDLPRATLDVAHSWFGARVTRARSFAAAAVLVVSCGALLLGYVALRRPATAAPPAGIGPARTNPSERSSTLQGDSVPRVPLWDVALTLFPQTRALERLPAVAVSHATERVAFELRLDVNDFGLYEAALLEAQTDAVVWRSAPVVVLSTDARPTVKVVVPANLLTALHYTFLLTGIDSRGHAAPVASYTFAVER
jgi:hypothetical protein